nr:site-specific integrase [Amycolatopsis sp.]
MGSAFKRCSCKDSSNRNLGNKCPRLEQSKHGQWCYRIELPADRGGNRRPRRRSGFETATKAQEELDQARDLLAIADEDDIDILCKIGDVIATAISEKQKLPEVDHVRRLVRAGADVLEHPLMDDVFTAFLATKKKSVSRNTYRSYESHVRLYLRPHLAHIRRDKLRVAHLAGMFDAIDEHNEVIGEYRSSGDPKKVAAVKWQRPVGPTSIRRIRETLRAVLNPAVKEGLLTVNVASLVELPPANRPKPKLWTAERVLRWQMTGEIPSPVMVWTPQHTGHFLDYTVNDRLYPLFHLIAHVGLRRGEACGQRRTDTYLDAASLEVANQIVQYGWETAQSKPKTTSSEGLVALDADTVLVLRHHLAGQDADRARLGSDWVDSGLLFTQPDGSPASPSRRHRPVRRADPAGWTATDPTTRPTPWRRDPCFGGWCRHEGRAEHAPALLDHRDHGHLHHRAARGRPRGGRSHRQDHPANSNATARARLGRGFDHNGQSGSGRNDSRKHKRPGHRFK